MRFIDLIQWTLKTLIANRSRSGLTVLGFAVGIAAVALLGSLGEGLREYVLKEFTQFGSHILTITPGKTGTLGLSGTLQSVRPLSLQDAEALRQVPGIEKVVPVVMGNAQVKYRDRGRYTDVAGVSSEGDEAWQLQLVQGEFLPPDDWFYARPTAVLGSKVKTELFGPQPAVGELIQIGGNRFRVVGVTAPKGQLLGFDMDDIVYIPAARGLQVFNRDSLMEIDAFYQPSVSADIIRKRIQQFFIQRHGVEDFTIVTQDEILKTLDNILTTLKAAAAGLGVISLFVGGVGILTMMLITVRERTWEIGLLAAVGFTPGQIRTLFLSEAICLSLIGGITGLAFVGILLIVIRSVFPTLPLMLDLTTVAAALVLAMIIGVLAGVKPAAQAAQLKPIDALRAE